MTSMGLGGLAIEVAAREALSAVGALGLVVRDFLGGGAPRAASVLLAMVLEWLSFGLVSRARVWQTMNEGEMRNETMSTVHYEL